MRNLLLIFFGLLFCGGSIAQNTVRWKNYVDSGNEIWFQAPEAVLFQRNNDAKSKALYAFFGGIQISVTKQDVGRNPIKYVKGFKLPFEKGSTTQDYKLSTFLVRQEIEPMGSDVHIRLYAGSSKSYFQISVYGAKDNPDINRFVETLRFGGSRILPTSNANDIAVDDEAIIFDELATSPEVDAALTRQRTGPVSDVKIEIIRQHLPLKLGELSRGLIVVQKPKAAYTDAARTRNVQGTIPVNVEFLANGDIGMIIVDNRLDTGLAKNVVDVVRKIKFVPAQANGKPVDVVRTMLYKFSIY